jgi:NAD+ diphosphatase
VVYPQIAPAVIVAVISGENILLARSSLRPLGWYSLISGYVDVGETLEASVIREVQEEVGISVHSIRYVQSQPWPLSASLMIGFVAEASEGQKIQVDGIEIAEAGWFSRDQLPDHPPVLSIAGDMIERFRKGELR